MMWLTPNTITHNNNNIHSQQQRQSPYSDHASRHSSFSSTAPSTSANFFNTIDHDTVLDLDSEVSSLSASSSPQSVAGPFPLSTFDSLPAANVSRTGHNGPFKFSTLDAQSQLLPPANMMYTDSWLGDSHQFTPKNNGRNTHNRESSLSSLGSLGPASPFSFNTANPQIAINEAGDHYQGMPIPDDQSYQLAAKAPNPTPHDTFYANFPYSSDSASVQAYANMLVPQKHRGDRGGLLPPPDFPSGNSSNSRPVSVASSVASDSPATPAAPEPEEDRRRKNGKAPILMGLFNPEDRHTCLPTMCDTAPPTVPKLDRTMTDIYSDELYNPNFTITSTAPQPPRQTAMSPTRELFAQRVQAANNQHLSATEPSVSTVSRGRSPFCHGSPLAPTQSHDFSQASANHVRFNSAQQMREKRKEMDAAQALRQAMAQPHTAGTPQTISPQDAVLEFNDTDDSNNFPLFPQQETAGFDANQLAKANTQANNFGGISLDTSFDNYMASQVPSGMQQMPHQYPFVAKQHRQQPSLSSVSNGSYSVSPRFGSSASASPDSAATSPRRPDGVRAEGGTYTCTYHGCTQRFETPAALQKHKREGHRQAHGLNGLRRPENPTVTPSNFFNTQAGPHKCERINPSTGKPCNTVFSRPYDLTRHEDTIHNARKQKVRCDVCTEEKTFSRADALTRHYRVCHPDLDFPGKHRRRGGSST